MSWTSGSKKQKQLRSKVSGVGCQVSATYWRLVPEIGSLNTHGRQRRRCLEGSLRGLRDRDDGLFPGDVDHIAEPRREEGDRRLLPGSVGLVFRKHVDQRQSAIWPQGRC